ncbi:hypothetical protein FB451DRAFT_1171166 [Mycena latifolia]|nr:hypothetical protein FB451DRAFT_1171166 [Mycena latifolia]
MVQAAEVVSEDIAQTDMVVLRKRRLPNWDVEVLAPNWDRRQSPARPKPSSPSAFMSRRGSATFCGFLRSFQAKNSCPGPWTPSNHHSLFLSARVLPSARVFRENNTLALGGPQADNSWTLCADYVLDFLPRFKVSKFGRVHFFFLGEVFGGSSFAKREGAHFVAGLPRFKGFGLGFSHLDDPVKPWDFIAAQSILGTLAHLYFHATSFHYSLLGRQRNEAYYVFNEKFRRDIKEPRYLTRKDKLDWQSVTQSPHAEINRSHKSNAMDSPKPVRPRLSNATGSFWRKVYFSPVLEHIGGGSKGVSSEDKSNMTLTASAFQGG